VGVAETSQYACAISLFTATSDMTHKQQCPLSNIQIRSTPSHLSGGSDSPCSHLSRGQEHIKTLIPVCNQPPKVNSAWPSLHGKVQWVPAKGRWRLAAKE